MASGNELEKLNQETSDLLIAPEFAAPEKAEVQTAPEPAAPEASAKANAEGVEDLAAAGNFTAPKEPEPEPAPEHSEAKDTIEPGAAPPPADAIAPTPKSAEDEKSGAVDPKEEKKPAPTAGPETLDASAAALTLAINDDEKAQEQEKKAPDPAKGKTAAAGLPTGQTPAPSQPTTTEAPQGEFGVQDLGKQKAAVEKTYHNPYTKKDERGYDAATTKRATSDGSAFGDALGATQAVEGGLDSVNGYDVGIVSFGIMQWSLHAGSLQKFLDYLKHNGPDGKAAFDQYFGSIGIDVDGETLIHNGQRFEQAKHGKDKKKNKEADKTAWNAINDLVRGDKATAFKWVSAFQKAGTDPRVQKTEISYLRKKFDDATGLKLDKYVGNCSKSSPARHVGQFRTASYWAHGNSKTATLYFSMVTNNPKYGYVGMIYAADDFMDTYGASEDKWPKDWPNRFSDILEAKYQTVLKTWGAYKDGKGKSHEGRVAKTLANLPKSRGGTGKENGAHGASLGASTPAPIDNDTAAPVTVEDIKAKKPAPTKHHRHHDPKAATKKTGEAPATHPTVEAATATAPTEKKQPAPEKVDHLVDKLIQKVELGLLTTAAAVSEFLHIGQHVAPAQAAISVAQIKEAKKKDGEGGGAGAQMQGKEGGTDKKEGGEGIKVVVSMLPNPEHHVPEAKWAGMKAKTQEEADKKDMNNDAEFLRNAEPFAKAQHATGIDSGGNVKAGQPITFMRKNKGDHPLALIKEVSEKVGPVSPEGTAGAPKNIKELAIFTHGWPSGFEFAGDSGKASQLGSLLHPNVTKTGFSLPLYACSTGADADHGVAEKIAEEFAKEGDEAHLFTHTTAGRATKNSHVREFDAKGGKVTHNDLGYDQVFPLVFPSGFLDDWSKQTYGGEKPPFAVEKAARMWLETALQYLNPDKQDAQIGAHAVLGYDKARGLASLKENWEKVGKTWTDKLGTKEIKYSLDYKAEEKYRKYLAA